MAVTTNLRTYEPFADMVRASPMFDLAGLFDFPRTRYGARRRAVASFAWPIPRRIVQFSRG